MSTATYGCPNGSSIVLDVGYSGLTANAQIKAAVDAYCKTGRSDKAQEAANALAPCQLNACTTVGAMYRSTMIYLIVSFSPLYRVIVWLWRPRA